jgi:hypothetical protein
VYIITLAILLSEVRSYLRTFASGKNEAVSRLKTDGENSDGSYPERQQFHMISTPLKHIHFRV